MLIETVKRWTIIALLIAIALLVLVLMAMRVDTAALHGQVTSLEQSNRALVDVASHNAEQVRQLIEDDKANDLLVTDKHKAIAIEREQTRNNIDAVRKSLHTEACAAVRLPDDTIRMLRSAGSNQNGSPIPNSTSSISP